MPTIKSAIQEVRDQLFLDRADGEFLTIVSENLGISRPLFGFANDDLWRAVVRRLALDTRQIENCFRDLLTLIFGPQKTVATVLGADVSISDEELTVSDQLRIPQLGTMIIDEGLASEETIEYSFRDPRDGTVELKTAATLAHTAVVDHAESFLRSDIAAAAVSIPVRNSSQFPTVFPTNYTLLLDPGSDNEEVVQLTGNTVATNTLTVTATANAHSGPTLTPNTSAYVTVSASGGVLTVFNSENFPGEGLIRIQEDGGATVEDVEYTSNDLANNQLQLKTKLQNAYTNAEVTLLNEGISVQLAQVKVEGVGWDIFQTEPRVVQIYLPEELEENRLQDVTFLHGPILGATPTTVASAALIGDTIVEVVNASTFPDSGVVDINAGADVVAYTIFRISTLLYSNDPTGVPIGTSVLFVENAKALYDAREVSRSLIIDRTGAAETVTWTSIDFVTNKITLSSPTTILHSTGDVVEVTSPGVNTLRLARGLSAGLAGGEAVVVVENAYAGFPALEDGQNLYSGEFPTALVPASNDHQYSGSYVWDILNRIAEVTSSLLNEDVAGPIDLLVSQRAGRTALEVRSAALLRQPELQELRIGRGLAGREDRQISAITLKRTVAGVTVAAGPPNPTAGSLQFNVTALSGLPDAYGYRLFLDDNGGGAGEEVVIVRDFTDPVVTLETPLQYNHSAGDDVELMADVIKVDALANDHAGIIKIEDNTKLVPLFGTAWLSGNVVGTPNDRFAKLEELREFVDLVSAANFPAAGGYAQINFGRNLNCAESTLVANYPAGTFAITVADGSVFPTVNFFIHIGVGTRVIETIKAASRAGNVISLNPPATNNLIYGHRAGEWVRYFPGEQEQIVYTGTETGGATERVTFDPSISFDQHHLEGEAVAVSGQQALPTNIGTDFPFYLPSRWQDRIEFLIDLARAAGVKVIISSDR